MPETNRFLEGSFAPVAEGWQGSYTAVTEFLV
jgi:hypothetical protein